MLALGESIKKILKEVCILWQAFPLSLCGIIITLSIWLKILTVSAGVTYLSVRDRPELAGSTEGSRMSILRPGQGSLLPQTRKCLFTASQLENQKLVLRNTRWCLSSVLFIPVAKVSHCILPSFQSSNTRFFLCARH